MRDAEDQYGGAFGWIAEAIEQKRGFFTVLALFGAFVNAAAFQLRIARFQDSVVIILLMVVILLAVR